jgi:putative spermidine/putrescine transport system permease protein
MLLQNPFSKAVSLLCLAALLAWQILPLLPLFMWSVARNWSFPDILPTAWSVAAWTYVFSNSTGVAASLAQTAVIGTATTCLALVVGIPAGRALAAKQFYGKGFLEMTVLAPLIVPTIATALGSHLLFLKLGLTGTFTGVILSHLVPALPYVIFVMSGVFANIDLRMEQQARTLGATATQTFYHVTLPAVGPGVAVAALFAFLVSWSQYVLTLVIGSGHVITLPLLLFNFVTAGRNDIMGALAVTYAIPCAALLILTARYLSGRHTSLANLNRR